MFKILGGLCIAFGLVDVIADRAFEKDITGVTWSPYVAFIVGYLLMKFAPDGGSDGEE